MYNIKFYGAVQCNNHVHCNELDLAIKSDGYMSLPIVVLDGAGLQSKGAIMRNASEVEDKVLPYELNGYVH